MKRSVRIASIVVAAAMLAGLLGCKTGSGATSRQAPTGPAVTIENLAFNPRSITVKQGATVTWTNRDTTTHTVSGYGFVSGPIAPGASYSHTFSTAGTYEYICTIHPSMVGIVVVQ